MAMFSVSGSFNNLIRFLDFGRRKRMFDRLEALGQQGVDALRAATPIDSGETANAWSYEIIDKGAYLTIAWNNSNLAEGWFPVAIGIQYGHATGFGGYVVGRDYINPALQPVFDRIAEQVWKAVTSA